MEGRQRTSVNFEQVAENAARVSGIVVRSCSETEEHSSSKTETFGSLSITGSSRKIGFEITRCVTEAHTGHVAVCSLHTHHGSPDETSKSTLPCRHG